MLVLDKCGRQAMSPARSAESLRSIKPDELYVASDAYQSLGWKAAAQRKARRLGLRVKYFGGRSYVLGRDLIQFLIENGKDSKDE